MRSGSGSGSGSPLTLVLGAACLFLAFPGAPLAGMLEWDRGAILDGQWWRLWTGHLVHFSPSHALADTLALCAAGTVAESWLGTRRIALALAAGATLVSLGLLVSAPDLHTYRGASGLAMLVAVLAGAQAWRRYPRAAPLLACCAVALGAKIAWEASSAAALSGLPADVAVAWQAHLLGALCGLQAHCARRLMRWRAMTPASPSQSRQCLRRNA